MTTGLAFLRMIKFKPLGGWKPRVKSPKLPPKELHMLPECIPALKSILQVVARSHQSGKVCHLLCSHMTPQELQFRTDTPLVQGDVLEVEILLSGLGNVKMMAQVQRATLIKRTELDGPARNVITLQTYSGTLELWPTEAQKENIKGFLFRQANRTRN